MSEGAPKKIENLRDWSSERGPDGVKQVTERDPDTGNRTLVKILGPEGNLLREGHFNPENDDLSYWLEYKPDGSTHRHEATDPPVSWGDLEERAA